MRLRSRSSCGLPWCHRCKRTAFIEAIYYTLISGSAQLVMAQRFVPFIGLNTFTHSNHDRTYAITRKNKWIAGFLYAYATVQFVIGVYVIVHAAIDQGQQFQAITHVRITELRDDTLTRRGARDPSASVSSMCR